VARSRRVQRRKRARRGHPRGTFGGDATRGHHAHGLRGGARCHGVEVFRAHEGHRRVERGRCTRSRGPRAQGAHGAVHQSSGPGGGQSCKHSITGTFRHTRTADDAEALDGRRARQLPSSVVAGTARSNDVMCAEADSSRQRVEPRRVGAREPQRAPDQSGAMPSGSSGAISARSPADWNGLGLAGQTVPSGGNVPSTR
jgi:hypothetical protein